MSVTLDLKSILLMLMIIAIIVLVVYLIIMVSKLLKTLDHANCILEDVENVSCGVSGTVSDISEAVKGNKNVITVAASAVKVASAFKSLVGSNEDDDLK